MCDTFVVQPPFTQDGSVLFGKNSDREPNEAQVLESRPCETFRKGETVKCTYIEIPQVSETRAVLLCRPFWMWGAEMGANDKGLVIGNEAVFTKMPVDRKGVLTGMDLVRLALERADTAEQGVETIIRLLSDHGQGGIGGFEDKRMCYHNSFLCADSREAWVLETAGPLWVTRRVEGVASISNGLTIGEEFDACHPDAMQTAKKKGWLKKGKPFHFAACFSDWFFTTFSACRTRQDRSSRLLSQGTEEGQSRFRVPDAMRVLRDHRGEAYCPDSHFLGNQLCAHAGNRWARNATQTTGSLVAHLAKNRHTYWATGTSAPCTGIFKPVWFGPNPLPDMGPPPERGFHQDALWWRHEMLHRSVLLDFPTRLHAYRQERDVMEGGFMEEAGRAAPEERSEVSERAFAQVRDATDRWTEQVRALPIRRRAKGTYRRYWHRQNRKAGIDISG
jgi:dipeptidase